VHRHQPLGLEVAEGLDGFVRPHVDVAKGVGIVGPNGPASPLPAGRFGRSPGNRRNRRCPRVVNAAALMLEQETAIAPVVVPQYPRAPSAWRASR